MFRSGENPLLECGGTAREVEGMYRPCARYRGLGDCPAVPARSSDTTKADQMEGRSEGARETEKQQAPSNCGHTCWSG